MLKVGDLAPEFSAQDQHGKTITLASLLERGRLVLYFYPKDFTPVCTAQACTFRDASSDLSSLSANVVGVSGDAVDSHQRFAEKHSVPFSLIADPERRIIKPYRASLPIINHTLRVTYVIDTNGRILGAFHHEFSAAKHLDDVKRALESAA
ncbi:MAG TPA: peroxiredoxin [Polyangiaceae bacterium]|nr:peroxiredoxin [Polyangiaceae bacterium]